MHPEQIIENNLDTLRDYHSTHVYHGTPPYLSCAFDAWLSMQGQDTLLEIINSKL